MAVVVSLGKAQRFLAVLKEQVKESSPKASARSRRYGYEEESNVSGVLSVDLSRATLTGENVVSDVQTQVVVAIHALVDAAALANDVVILKEAIFARNQETGLSAKIARSELVKDLIKTKKTLVKSVEKAGINAVNPEQLDERLFQRLAAGIAENKDSATLEVRLVDAAALRSEIASLRVELNDLDEEIRALNATMKVTVDLSPQARAVLGLS